MTTCLRTMLLAASLVAALPAHQPRSYVDSKVRLEASLARLAHLRP